MFSIFFVSTGGLVVDVCHNFAYGKWNIWDDNRINGTNDNDLNPKRTIHS